MFCCLSIVSRTRRRSPIDSQSQYLDSNCRISHRHRHRLPRPRNRSYLDAEPWMVRWVSEETVLPSLLGFQNPMPALEQVLRSLLTISLRGQPLAPSIDDHRKTPTIALD